jgi:flagellar hook-associated protein 2
MAGISITGLISGSFDWQSVVNQLIQIDTVPVTRLQTQEATNNDKLTSLSALKTDLTGLQTAAQALNSTSLFTERTATSSASDSNWDVTAADGATTGSYTVSVSQLATAAQRQGSSGISAPLNGTSDVSGLTLANLSTATSVTAGTFSIDGQVVTVALTDSLQDVFGKISTATGGNVTAAYDSATDRISLTSGDGSDIILGAGNDTSNFLPAMKLANAPAGAGATLTSAGTLGSVALNATLASSRLRGALSPDVDGNGTFSINGVAIDYNVNTDTLSTVLQRINASGAGVSAGYDSANDRFILTNTATGDTGIGATEVSGGLLDALGLGGGATLQRGQNALFSVNNGVTISSASNTLSSAVLGVTGLTVTARSVSSQTVTVAPDASAMQGKIEKFIDAYNAIQGDITAATASSVAANGKVKTSTLTGNLEVQSWASQLRSMAFASISGLGGAIDSLDKLGIGFAALGAPLSILDQTKLTNALTATPDDVGTFFNTASTGFGAKFTTYIDNLTDPFNGSLVTQTNTLNKQNTDIDAQIVTLNKRLDDERTKLTNAFLAMQTAQSQAQSQQATLTNMFPAKSTSS